MIERGGMKQINGKPQRRRGATTPKQRAELLAAYERSGLSGAAFARRHRIAYTTFCAWRTQQAKTQATPGFVEVELPAQAAPEALLIELGTQGRLRITSKGQIDWAVRLLRQLNTPDAC